MRHSLRVATFYPSRSVDAPGNGQNETKYWISLTDLVVDSDLRDGDNACAPSTETWLVSVVRSFNR
jgi:hypothetical protein